MKTLAISVLIILFANNSFSVNLNWVKGIGSDKREEGYSITTDADGNSYITGYFSDTVDFNPDPNKTKFLISNGLEDIFVLKLDTGGNLLWVRQIGAALSDVGTSICLDKWNNVIVTGNFGSTADFNPDPNRTYNITAGGSADAFVLRMNNDGVFLWARGIGSSSFEAGYSVAPDDKGNVYTGGEFNGATDFDPGSNTFTLTPVKDRDAFVLKLDSAGWLVWAKQIGGNGYETARSIAVQPAGVIYIAGDINGNADLDPGAGTYNVTGTVLRFFLLKLNASGSFVWAKVMPIGLQWANADRALTLDASGLVFLTGNFQGTIDFDPDTAASTFKTSQGNRDAFIMKLNSIGRLVWVSTIGGTGTNTTADGYSITLDVNSNVYATGRFSGTVDFNPGSSSYNLGSVTSQDVFVLKLNASGDLVWAKSMKGEGIGACLSIDPFRNVYVTGMFKGSVDFNPDSSRAYNVSALGLLDCFVLKLEQCKNTTSSLIASACYSYQIEGKTYTKSGVYKITTMNVTGCDSIITLTLRILKSTDSAISIVSCDSVVYNNVTYKSSGTYTQKLVNANGCDSLLTLNITIKRSYDTSIYAVACDSFTWGQVTYYISGVYKRHLLSYFGCDSNVTLHLDFLNNGDTIITSVCDSFVLNGKAYTQTGKYSQHLTNYKGCDSVLILILIVKKSQSNITVNACDSYTLNQITYSESGKYIQKTKNYLGCDSVINLVVNLTKIDTSILYQGNQLKASRIDTHYTYQWINCQDGTPLLGETDSVLDLISTGSYGVVITLNQCSDTSPCYYFQKTGMEEWKISGRPVLYPNPMQDRELKFYIPESVSPTAIEIYDELGRKVFEVKGLPNGYNALNVSLLEPGIYYLQVVVDDSRFRFKFLVPQ